MRNNTVSIINRTKGKLPRLPFEQFKQAILPKDYVVSLVFAGDTLSRRLNRTYRKKSYVPNVLSFPLGPGTGEIIINPRVAGKEAPRFNLSTRSYLAYLFIHGCLHLDGVRHGVTMETIERRLLRRFHLS